MSSPTAMQELIFTNVPNTQQHTALRVGTRTRAFIDESEATEARQRLYATGPKREHFLFSQHYSKWNLETNGMTPRLVNKPPPGAGARFFRSFPPDRFFLFRVM
ncbi:hypothetical protein EVAR_18173_1 [Eumeta japonica]|uniref:Uncharacterized protein n=1 Tax=Eumeta variegata TaxID=151549 RepID=A0A4C1UX77_EUMVA|nr:hypothetical protein EVAR_18173_1 [Eumeta japonica]